MMNSLMNMSINELVRKLEANKLNDTALALASIGEKVLFEVTYYTNRIEYNGSNLTIEEVLANLVYASTEKALLEVLKRASFLLSELEEEVLIDEVEEAVAVLKEEYEEVLTLIDLFRHNPIELSKLIDRKITLKYKILEKELTIRKVV